MIPLPTWPKLVVAAGGTEFIKENPEFQFGYARFEMTVTYSSRNVSQIDEF